MRVHMNVFDPQSQYVQYHQVLTYSKCGKNVLTTVEQSLVLT